MLYKVCPRASLRLVQVIIGGGRMYMTPVGTKDPEYPKDLTKWGKRRDKRNLIDEWQSMKTGKVTDFGRLGLGSLNQRPFIQAQDQNTCLNI